MSLSVIGAGVGRTGTYSLKLAINELGLGPCHHMEEVLFHIQEQVPMWSNALSGHPSWEKIFEGYNSAVDWPTAGFFDELNEFYPEAKFILTDRDPKTWAESFSDTIYTLLASKDTPPHMGAWMDMAKQVIKKTGFPPGLSVQELTEAFEAHSAAVKAMIPKDRLLVYQVKQGWEPLCEFLDKPVPDKPFPRTNDRGEFWDRIKGAS